MATPAFWRKWHRWIAFPAALFLLFASVTGVIVAVTEFFGEAEALREATRDLVSPVRVSADARPVADPIARALATARTTAPDAPIDKIVMQFKGAQPTVEIFTGRPEGGKTGGSSSTRATARCCGRSPTPTSRSSTAFTAVNSSAMAASSSR
jgi:uncharacterized iron-regulated membrane protein